jgi:hypothetical protein
MAELLTVKGIPEELKRKFDGYTRLAGSNMSEVLRQAMVDYVNEAERGRKMTKKEFLETDTPLGYIISLNPKTGKVLHGAYSADEVDGLVEEFEQDFPDMIHFTKRKNPAARALSKKLREGI